MNLSVKYFNYPQGKVNLVASKSISNRALIIDALSGYQSKLKNLSVSDDTLLLMELLTTLRKEGDQVELNAGIAGTVMRFMTTFCCLQKKKILLTGHDRMKQRPIADLVNGLNQLGASISYAEKKGFPPLNINPSVIKGNKIGIDASVSSQFISSLMLCAPYFEEGLEIKLLGKQVSSSYITLTKQIMAEFGIHVQSPSPDLIVIPKGIYRPQTFTIEADWSSASYFVSLAALSKKAEIEIAHLSLKSSQGDKAIAEIGERFGVKNKPTAAGMLFYKEEEILPDQFEFDFNNCPDIVQTIVVMLAGLKIKKARLTGISTLRHKETDRIEAIVKELSKFNVLFPIVSDSELIMDASGFSPRIQTISTYNDHRMAMSFAPLAQCTGAITIENAEVVNKSYQQFWHDFKLLGCLTENTDI